MIYAIPYLLLVGLYGFLAIYVGRDTTTPDIKTRVGYICAALFFFFFGFRGFCFDDWQVYHEHFMVCDWSRTFDYYRSDDVWAFEPGFTLLINLCRLFGEEYQVLVIVTSLIDTFLLMRFFNKRFDNIPLAFMLFLSFSGIACMMNIVRNMIAILIFINALQYIWERKPFPYFSLCLLATLFHSSSLLFFPLYFFLHRECPKWLYIAIFAIGNLILLLNIRIFYLLISLFFGNLLEIFQDKIEAYMDMEGGFVISIGYLERLLTGTLIICYFDKLKKVRKDNALFINLSLIYFAFFFFFSEFATMSRRLSNLFVVSYWVLWTDLIKCFFHANNRRLFVLFLSLYCMLRVAISTNGPIKEYENVLFGAKSYQERLYIWRQNYEEEE